MKKSNNYKWNELIAWKVLFFASWFMYESLKLFAFVFIRDKHKRAKGLFQTLNELTKSEDWMHVMSEFPKVEKWFNREINKYSTRLLDFKKS